MKTRRFVNQYADNGKELRLKVREAAGHRCIRCAHPFESGKHGKGEWSPCDERCTHKGAIRMSIVNGRYEPVWSILEEPSETAGGIVKSGRWVQAQWRILTIHHADGDKANDHWSNTLPLCQRCHLTIQGKVDPRIPWMLEHSNWIKPYAAAWNSLKYEGKWIERKEAEERMEELLAYECRVKSESRSGSQK